MRRKFILIVCIVALLAFAIFQIANQINDSYSTIYTRTYSHSSGMVMSHRLDSLNLSGNGIKIGVLDAGFGKMRTNRWTMSLQVEDYMDFVSGDTTSFFNHNYDHGTLNCMNIGGCSGDTIRGLAYNATYFLAKVDDPDKEPREDESRMIEGIKWLVSKDVDIISSSVAYTVFDDDQSYTPHLLDGKSSRVSRFLDSILCANPHLVFVQSVGNKGRSDWKYICFPADVSKVISVGASDWKGEQKSSGSGLGPDYCDYIKPDFVVYDSPLGTSFSTPIISGLCAVLLEYRKVEREVLINALHCSGTNAANPDRMVGYGVPQSEVALRKLAESCSLIGDQ